MDESYEQQAQAEMYDAIAAQERAAEAPVTYRVRASSPRYGVVATGFPTLQAAQRARDKWERSHRGISAVVERSTT